MVIVLDIGGRNFVCLLVLLSSNNKMMIFFKSNYFELKYQLFELRFSMRTLNRKITKHDMRLSTFYCSKYSIKHVQGDFQFFLNTTLIIPKVIVNKRIFQASADICRKKLFSEPVDECLVYFLRF